MSVPWLFFVGCNNKRAASIENHRRLVGRYFRDIRLRRTLMLPRLFARSCGSHCFVDRRAFIQSEERRLVVDPNQQRYSRNAYGVEWLMIPIIAGLTYGLILGLLSFLLMGAGHGTYVPFTISSAPFGLVTYLPFTVVFGLIAIPILWAFVALAAERRRHHMFRVALIVHYVGVALSLINPMD